MGGVHTEVETWRQNEVYREAESRDAGGFGWLVVGRVSQSLFWGYAALN